MTDQFCKYYNERADFFSQFNMKIPNDDDIRISEMILNEIRKIVNDYNLNTFKYPPVVIDGAVKTSGYDIEPYLKLSLESMKNIGCGQYCDNISYILSNINYYTFDHPAPAFAVIQSQKMICNYFINTPIALVYASSLSATSKFGLLHEFAHLLKEDNCREFCLYFTKIEVIPMAVELITALHEGNLINLKSLVKERILLLLIDIQNYLILRDELNHTNSDNRKRAVNIALNSHLKYLNSFYYSLILFRLYLDEPEYIIELINMVLGCQITSEEMFDYLDKKKFDNYASDGLAEIKKYLK